MAGATIKNREEILDQDSTPHLSHSRINRYLTCPEQYRIYYIERLRPKIEGAGLLFGALIHVALADLFRNGTDPVQEFECEWDNQTAHVNKQAQHTHRRGGMTAKVLQLRLYSFRRLTLVQYCTWSLV